MAGRAYVRVNLPAGSVNSGLNLGDLVHLDMLIEQRIYI